MGVRRIRISAELLRRMLVDGIQCAIPEDVPKDLKLLDARRAPPLALNDFELLAASAEFPGTGDSWAEATDWAPTFRTKHATDLGDPGAS